MPASQLFFNDTVTVTASATALSIYTLVTTTLLSANLPGQCVSLNLSADVDIKMGYGTVDETHGVTLSSGTMFQDSATGAGGNTIPIGQMYLYAPAASGNATVTIFLRFIG